MSTFAPIRTFNRGKLLRLIKAGRVVATGSYHFDDMYGESRGLPREMPVEINPGDFKLRREGVVYVWESDFTGYGRAWYHGDSTDRVHLRIHSNSSLDFRILP